MFETNELWREVVRVGGVKRIMAAIGRSDETVYRWESQRGMFDWLEAVIQVLVLRPEGRSILIRLHYWIDQLFRRALDGSAEAVPLERLRAKAVHLLHETADVIDKCTCADVERAEVVREALEAREVLDRIIQACEGGFEEVPQPSRLRGVR